MDRDRKRGMENSTQSSSTESGDAAQLSKSVSSRSFMGRLSTSATGLVQDAFLRPGGARTAQALATLAANNEKGESSSSSAGSAESTRTIESGSSRPPSAGSASMPGSSVRLGGSFRSYSASLNATDIEHLDTFLSSQNPSLFPKIIEGKGGHPDLSAQDSENDRISDHSMIKDFHIFSKHDIRQDILNEAGQSVDTSHATSQSPPYSYDGAAVVALLSEPGFSVDDEPLESTLEPVPWHKQSHAVHHEGTKGKESARDQLHMGRDELALIPNFAEASMNAQAAADAMPYAQELASTEDLKPWLDILESYQDEVWGDFLPLVRQAREEINEAKAGDPNLDDKPAIRRLRMLLGHLDHNRIS